MPIYNRNQGGIERAKINVTSRSSQLADAERQAQIDVEEALQEYAITRRQVKELEDEVIPEAQQGRDEAFKLLTTGAQSIPDYINAQLEFNQIVKQYLDTAIRHRRSMLSINTVVGKTDHALTPGNRDRGSGRIRDRRGDDGTPNRRRLRPDLEAFEQRVLLSAITDVFERLHSPAARA